MKTISSIQEPVLSLSLLQNAARFSKRTVCYNYSVCMITVLTLIHILGLDVEGIFRISGSAKRVNALEFQFDQSTSSYGLDLNWEGYTVHDAASLFRRYLNRLPDPVIPFEYYQQFRDVMSKTREKKTFKCLVTYINISCR